MPCGVLLSLFKPCLHGEGQVLLCVLFEEAASGISATAHSTLASHCREMKGQVLTPVPANGWRQPEDVAAIAEPMYVTLETIVMHGVQPLSAQVSTCQPLLAPKTVSPGAQPSASPGAQKAGQGAPNKDGVCVELKHLHGIEPLLTQVCNGP